jgi:hypothetical protein
MSQRAAFLFAAFASVACAGTAQAEDFRLAEEVRVSFTEHDTNWVGNRKEEGYDFGAEIISSPLLDNPVNPRLVLGVQVNTEGYTNQLYAGLLAQRDIFSGVFNDGDAIFLEGTVGIAYHDGKLDVVGTPEEAEWKSHGSELVFRTGFGVGYRFNERTSLSFGLHHISNADIVEPNEGSNDIGFRLGWKL